MSNSAEQKLAFDVYVELATRITLRPIPREASLREALKSIYGVIAECRQSLHTAGPVAAQSSNGGTSAGEIVASIINETLAPFLSLWHFNLSQHEGARPAGVSAHEWENGWSSRSQMTAELEGTRAALWVAAEELQRIAGIAPLLKRVPQPEFATFVSSPERQAEVAASFNTAFYPAV